MAGYAPAALRVMGCVVKYDTPSKNERSAWYAQYGSFYERENRLLE